MAISENRPPSPTENHPWLFCGFEVVLCKQASTINSGSCREIRGTRPHWLPGRPGSFLSCLVALLAGGNSFLIQENMPISLLPSEPKDTVKSQSPLTSVRLDCPGAGNGAPPCLPRQENRKRPPPCREVGLPSSLPWVGTSPGH